MKYGEKKTSAWGWSRTVTVDGVEYRVGVERGRPVRMAYSSRHGFRWSGWVKTGGRTIWGDEIPGGIGARGLLKRAGVLPK